MEPQRFHPWAVLLCKQLQFKGNLIRGSQADGLAEVLFRALPVTAEQPAVAQHAIQHCKAVARAVAREAEIYIFDDTFSALDYKTDRELRQALKDEMQDATCLIVAQRIGTIMDADLILVLENGRVVGQGTHKELLENCPAYQEIARSQLSEEELL